MLVHGQLNTRGAQLSPSGKSAPLRSRTPGTLLPTSIHASALAFFSLSIFLSGRDIRGTRSPRVNTHGSRDPRKETRRSPWTGRLSLRFAYLSSTRRTRMRMRTRTREGEMRGNKREREEGRMRRAARIRTYDSYTTSTALRGAETPSSACSDDGDGDGDNDAAGHHPNGALSRTQRQNTDTPIHRNSYRPASSTIHHSRYRRPSCAMTSPSPKARPTPPERRRSSRSRLVGRVSRSHRDNQDRSYDV